MHSEAATSANNTAANNTPAASKGTAGEAPAPPKPHNDIRNSAGGADRRSQHQRKQDAFAYHDQDSYTSGNLEKNMRGGSKDSARNGVGEVNTATLYAGYTP